MRIISQGVLHMSRPSVWRTHRRLALALIPISLLAAGCGQQYVVLNPAGPVGLTELHLIETTSIAMGIVIAFVLVLFGITLWRFRDRPQNTAPYSPNWEGSRRLEIILFAIPVLIVAIIAVPTVQDTFKLSHVPPARNPVIVDVTSLDWKWLFQYPQQHIATVNYIDVPTGVPVLFELTADSPMNT
ncbi:quinol oxidase AA3, subunit II, partial [mine drainage metagenome]